MIDLNAIDWANLFSHPFDDPGPWLAFLAAGFAVLIGYVEMRTNRNLKIGLSTWLLALPPYCFVVYWLLTWDKSSIVVRIALVIALTLLSWKALQYLYEHAKTHAKAVKQDGPKVTEN